jgi:hypothetical protein
VDKHTGMERGVSTAHIAKIRPHLFIASYYGASKRDLLVDHNIKYIINCAKECPCDFSEQEGAECPFIYHQCNLNDYAEETISQHFVPCHTIIERAREEGVGAVVHCQAGVSRSATIVLSYLMWHDRMSLKDALLHLTKIKPNVQPNVGYMQQLMEYEQEVLGKATLTMQEYYVMVLVSMGFNEETVREAMQTDGSYIAAMKYCLNPPSKEK